MSQDNRRQRQIQRARLAAETETKTQAQWLRSRDDWFDEYDYFLNLLENGPQSLAQRTGRRVMAVVCLSVPLELFEAAGLQVLRLTGGHMAADRLAFPYLPAVMCPMLRSALGLSLMNQTATDGTKDGGWAGQVISSTCFCAQKFESLQTLCGAEKSPSYFFQIPKKKNSHLSLISQLSEVRNLGQFIRQITGNAISRKALKNAVCLFREIYAALSDLIEAKRQSRISQILFALVTGAFSLDLPVNWLNKVEKLLRVLNGSAVISGPKIFLAGSPIIFPNFKILRLLEEAGLTAAIDDLCSSERILPGPVHLGDDSWEGMLEALAQRYHLGCLCPVFADDDRRINNITSPEHLKLVQGLVFHVLKGCQPFDLESLVLEEQIKAKGLKYIRLETDNENQDAPALFTRLEAFRQTLS